MGRKPNPIIGEYFTRGPKLSDSSNRYPHTCKLCGENFPKGRGEVLHKHITEKCPAITPEERINAALGFAGLGSGAVAQRQGRINFRVAQAGNAIASAPETPETWSALRTLAEASRQVGANELVPHRDGAVEGGIATNDQGGANGFNIQDQHFGVEHPPLAYGSPTLRSYPSPMPDGSPNPLNNFTAEERLEHLQAATQEPAPSAMDSSNLAVAAEAAARIDHRLMSPELNGSTEPQPVVPSTVSVQQPEPPSMPQAPWAPMTYVQDNLANHATSQPALPTLPAPIRGGTRISISNGARGDHKRKAYTPSRRKEVQAARKKGACIRCRILRKTCGLNDPCDQCRKIQGPRHWTYPCVRTHLNQILTLYSAGLTVVLAQSRVNQARDSFDLVPKDYALRVSLWSDSVPMSLLALFTTRKFLTPNTEQNAAEGEDPYHVAMIDQDKEDLPARMEEYLHQILPMLIAREPSHHVRIVLDFARRATNTTGELVRRAIDLWGLVEILDRERSWCISEDRDGQLISRGPDNIAGAQQDIYNLITWQLSAAVERKANSVSQKLVSELQRCLENGKTIIHFDVYLASLILLQCLEKTTWTIKVWEMDDFRQRWPLEKPPSDFTSQGHQIAELLKMLLTLRKVHPKTVRAPNGLLALENPSEPLAAEFFESLHVQYDEVVQKVERCAFSPEGSRSLDFHFSGILLLPHREGEQSSQSRAQSSPNSIPNSIPHEDETPAN